MKRGGWIALAAFVVVNLALLVADARFLVWETTVNPGQPYVVADYGDVGKNDQASLVCRYWTGRSVVTNVLWYSTNNVMGRDQCPFFVRAGQKE